ncbi:MAG: hypothetical protein ACT4PT_08455 [Methanobacteriota archaeon]
MVSRAIPGPVRRYLLFGGLAAVGIAAAAGLSGIFSPDGPPTDPGDGSSEGILLVRPGDRFTYSLSNAGGRFEVEIEAASPRLVASAALAPVEGLPFLVTVRAPGVSGTDAYVTDVRRGGLAVRADACLLDANRPCRDPEAAQALVSWQNCPLVGVFSPVDLLPRSALGGTEAVVEDPLKGTQWTFAVAREGDRVRLTLEDVSDPRDTCRLPYRSFLVDLDRGVLEEASGDGGTFRLERMATGEGPPITLGGGRGSAARIVAPETERTTPFPPGAGTMGPPEWRLDAAWERARRDSPDLQRFLAAHPEAFAYELSNTSSNAEVLPAAGGGVRDVTYAWRIGLLATDRAMLEVVAEKRTTQGVPRYETRTSSVLAPPEVPTEFRPPAKRAADLRAFVAAVTARGFAPPPSYADPSVTVLFDAGDADYYYTLFLGGDPSSAFGVEGAVSTQWILFNADTGRITDATLPKDAARRLLSTPG